MTKEPETLRAHQIKMSFFQDSTLTEICRKLVTHYFLLTQDELDMWDADPETFVNDEVGESWKYSLRVNHFIRINFSIYRSNFLAQHGSCFRVVVSRV